jgi:hypothetical protein
MRALSPSIESCTYRERTLILFVDTLSLSFCVRDTTY